VEQNKARVVKKRKQRTEEGSWDMTLRDSCGLHFR